MGINIHEYTEYKTGISITASLNLNVMSENATTVGCHVTATTALAGVWEGTYDDINDPNVTADWFPLPAIITDTGAITENLPGATITPDDDDVMFAATLGAKFTRFRRTAGVGTVSTVLTHLSLTDIQSSVSLGAAVDTELPPAAALADNTATPTAPAVGAFGMLYDGATWDMARGTAADGALVNLGTNNDVTAVGPIADDATTPGAPVMIGGTAKETDGTTPGSVSAEDDVTRLITDRHRILLVNETAPFRWNVSADYGAAQTNASIKAAPADSTLSHYVTDLVISNGAVAGNITLLDGSGGAVLFEMYPAINGGITMSFRNPIKLTANTALCITSTTVTTHAVNVCGYTAL